MNVELGGFECVLAPADNNERLEAVRQVCAAHYLEGCHDTKVIDPIKDNFPSCTVPLSCVTPLTVSPTITRNPDHAREYLSRVSLLREVLEQSPVQTDPVQSLSGLLTHSSKLPLIMEPIPAWSIARVIGLCDRADAVFQQTRALEVSADTPISML